MTPPKATYFAAPDSRGTLALHCAWDDGTIAERRWMDIVPLGQSAGWTWIPVRGPDYLVIRAELTHPEETVPVADQPSPDDHTLVWDGKPWQCRCPTCRPK